MTVRVTPCSLQDSQRAAAAGARRPAKTAQKAMASGILGAENGGRGGSLRWTYPASTPCSQGLAEGKPHCGTACDDIGGATTRKPPEDVQRLSSTLQAPKGRNAAPNPRQATCVATGAGATGASARNAGGPACAKEPARRSARRSMASSASPCATTASAKRGLTALAAASEQHFGPTRK